MGVRIFVIEILRCGGRSRFVADRRAAAGRSRFLDKGKDVADRRAAAGDLVFLIGTYSPSPAGTRLPTFARTCPPFTAPPPEARPPSYRVARKPPAHLKKSRTYPSAPLSVARVTRAGALEAPEPALAQNFARLKILLFRIVAIRPISAFRGSRLNSFPRVTCSAAQPRLHAVEIEIHNRRNPQGPKLFFFELWQFDRFRRIYSAAGQP
jgi:hypothetical protein